MAFGYLAVETHSQRPGLIRLLISRAMPEGGAEQRSPQIEYIARFDDVDTACMHVHELLHRDLVDLENRIYRNDLIDAVAAIEVSRLRHKTVYQSSELQGESARTCLRKVLHGLYRRQERVECFWTWVGRVAMGLLVLQMLFTL